MKKEILALLLAKFEGVRKDGLLALAGALSLQATTKEKASELVEALDKEKVEDFVKDYRSSVDREVTESKVTIEENLKKKYKIKGEDAKGGGDDNIEEPTPGEGSPTDPMSLEDAIAKAVDKAVKPLSEALSTITVEKQRGARSAIIEAKLKDCRSEVLKNSTRKYFERMSFEDEESFEEFAKELDNDIQEANKLAVEDGLSGLNPITATGKSDGVSQAVQDFISGSKTEDSKFTGKEI